MNKQDLKNKLLKDFDQKFEYEIEKEKIRELLRRLKVQYITEERKVCSKPTFYDFMNNADSVRQETVNKLREFCLIEWGKI